VGRKFTIKKKSIFFQFWLPYILIFCLPLIIGMFTYQKTLKIIEEDALNNNLALLDQTREVLDKSFEDMNSMVSQISLNNQLKSIQFMKNSSELKDMWNIFQAADELSVYQSDQGFIKDFYIYFKDSSLILTPETFYTRLPIFYKYFFNYSDMSFEQWKSEILDKFYGSKYLPVAPAKFKGKESNVITYIRSLPFEYGNLRNAKIYCFIDEKEIHKLMQKLQIGETGWAYIIDNEGNILTSIGKPAVDINAVEIPEGGKTGFIEGSIYGEDMMISYTKSLFNQWTYVAVLPSEVILAKAKYIKSLFIIISLIVFVIGLLATCLIAERSSRPVQHALDALSQYQNYEQYGKGNIFDFLKNNILGIISSNRNLKDAVDQQIPLVKAAFFDRLLNGSFSDLEGMDETLDQIALNMKDKSYLVVLMQKYGYEKLVSLKELKVINNQKARIVKSFDKHIEKQGYIHDISTDCLALILSFSEEKRNAYKGYTEAIIENVLRETYPEDIVKIRCAAGNMYDNLLDIAQSYNEAKQILNENRLLDKESMVLWYEEEKSINSHTYYYPIELEMKMMNFVKGGHMDQIQESLNEIFEENFKKRNLPPFMKRQLIHEIKSTMVKVMGQLKIEKENDFQFLEENFSQLDACQTTAQVYEHLIIFYKDACKGVNKTKKSHNTQLKEDVIEYIHKNFSNADMGLGSVADHFIISEDYLSQFFKEQTGENFSAYLEKVRMENADQLLIKDNNTIEEIARMSGYNSANTFRRAYKRFYGIRPTDRKKIHNASLTL
jgi:two-component system, response regulator YesN